jgi:hypothetical protein
LISFWFLGALRHFKLFLMDTFFNMGIHTQILQSLAHACIHI